MSPATLRRLRALLSLLAASSPDGVPTSAALLREAERIEHAAETLRGASARLAAEYAETARALREMAS